MISFTPQERKALLFLVIVLVVGSGITLYKKYHSDFAPELLLKPQANAVRSNLAPSNLNLPAESSRVNSKEISTSVISEEKVRQVNLNSATQYELEKLPSIGPILAKRIVEYRKQNGGFKKIEEIQKVQGIGKKIFEAIKNQIAVN